MVKEGSGCGKNGAPVQCKKAMEVNGLLGRNGLKVALDMQGVKTSEVIHWLIVLIDISADCQSRAILMTVCAYI